jgi:hypothetical protein
MMVISQQTKSLHRECRKTQSYSKISLEKYQPAGIFLSSDSSKLVVRKYQTFSYDYGVPLAEQVENA